MCSYSDTQAYDTVDIGVKPIFLRKSHKGVGYGMGKNKNVARRGADTYTRGHDSISGG